MSENWDRYCLPADADCNIINLNYEALKERFGSTGNTIVETDTQQLINKFDIQPIKQQDIKKSYFSFGKKDVEYVLPPHPVNAPYNDWSYIFHYRINMSLDCYKFQILSTNPSDATVEQRIQAFKNKFDFLFNTYQESINTTSFSITKNIMMWRQDKHSRCTPNTPTIKEKLKSLVDIIELSESDPNSNMIDSSFQTQYTSLSNRLLSTAYGSRGHPLGSNEEMMELLRDYFFKLLHLLNTPISVDIWHNQRPNDFNHAEVQGLMNHSLSRFISIYRKVMDFLYNTHNSLLGNNGVDYTVHLVLSDINNIYYMLLEVLKKKYLYITQEDPSIWVFIEELIRDALFEHVYPFFYTANSLLYIEKDGLFDSSLSDLSTHSPRSMQIPSLLFKDYNTFHLSPEEEQGYTDIDKEWIYLEMILKEPISIFKDLSNELSPLLKLSKLYDAFVLLNGIGKNYSNENQTLFRSQLILLIKFTIICASFTSNVSTAQLLNSYLTDTMKQTPYYDALNLYQEAIQVMNTQNVAVPPTNKK